MWPDKREYKEIIVFLTINTFQYQKMNRKNVGLYIHLLSYIRLENDDDFIHSIIFFHLFFTLKNQREYFVIPLMMIMMHQFDKYDKMTMICRWSNTFVIFVYVLDFSSFE